MNVNNERFDSAAVSMRGIGWLAVFLSLSAGVHGFAGVAPSNEMKLKTSGKVNSVTFSPRRKSRCATKPYRRSNFFSKLQYQNVDSADGGLNMADQDLVDDYLEFLDRRYHRFNDENDGAIKFSALKWLTQGQEDEKPDDTLAKEQEEDALYVLGVAGLASQKLLSKHKLVSKEESAETMPKKDVVDIPNAQRVDSRVLAAASPFMTVFRRMEAQRRLFLRYQVRKSNAMVVFMLRKLISTPAMAALAVKELWNVGGGKKALAYTLTACATAMLILRPLLRAVLSEAFRNA